MAPCSWLHAKDTREGSQSAVVCLSFAAVAFFAVSDDGDDELQQLLQQFNSLESTETFETDPAAAAAAPAAHRHPSYTLQHLTSAALGANGFSNNPLGAANPSSGGLKRARRPSDPNGVLTTHGSGHLSPAAAAAAVQGYGAYGAALSPAQVSRPGSGLGYNRAGYRAVSASGLPAGWRADEGYTGVQIWQYGQLL